MEDKPQHKIGFPSRGVQCGSGLSLRTTTQIPSCSYVIWGPGFQSPQRRTEGLGIHVVWFQASSLIIRYITFIHISSARTWSSSHSLTAAEAGTCRAARGYLDSALSLCQASTKTCLADPFFFPGTKCTFLGELDTYLTHCNAVRTSSAA